MLTLTIARDAFKICHKEGTRTTVWDVSKGDGEEALIQTFKDVIAFVEGEQAPQASGALRAPAGPGEYTVSVEPATGNGWAAVYGPPALPARLQGEVELVQPGEGA